MASGKAMANPDRIRGDTKAELEAKLQEADARFRKIHEKVAELNARTEETLATLRWHPYLAILVALLSLAAAASVILL